MKAIWLTDIHLNFCEEGIIREFVQGIKRQKPDTLLIGGDIGEADFFEGYLQVFERELQRPIYFVLGNHDAYRGSIHGMRETAATLSRESDFLGWLPEVGVVELTSEVGLIGHGGWGDGRLGSFYSSTVQLNDFKLIAELKGKRGDELLRRLMELGDEAAAHFEKVLPEAIDRFRSVIVLTASSNLISLR